MKKHTLLTAILCTFSVLAFAQIKATTKNGDEVILNNDFTWEYAEEESDNSNWETDDYTDNNTSNSSDEEDDDGYYYENQAPAPRPVQYMTLANTKFIKADKQVIVENRGKDGKSDYSILITKDADGYPYLILWEESKSGSYTFKNNNFKKELVIHTDQFTIYLSATPLYGYDSYSLSQSNPESVNRMHQRFRIFELSDDDIGKLSESIVEYITITMGPINMKGNSDLFNDKPLKMGLSLNKVILQMMVQEAGL